MAGAAASDFVFVNLSRGVIGAPMRPDAVGELLAAASRRAGLAPAVRIALPVLYVLIRAMEAGPAGIWAELARPYTFGLLANTLILSSSVTAICVVAGTAMAVLNRMSLARLHTSRRSQPCRVQPRHAGATRRRDAPGIRTRPWMTVFRPWAASPAQVR